MDSKHRDINGFTRALQKCALPPAFEDLPQDNRGIAAILFYAGTRWGHESVLMFFALSGFLVGGKSIQRLLNSSFSLTDYCIDRGVRIGLPLLGACLVYIPVMYICGHSADWQRLAGNLLSLQGIIHEPLLGPFWSLSYEVWFYILMGSIAGFFVVRKKFRVISLLVLMLCMAVFLRLHVGSLFIWLLGACFFFILPPAHSKLRLLGACALLAASRCGLFNWEILAYGSLNEFVWGISCCWFMRELVLWKPQAAWMARFERVGSVIARFSYTIYLTHILFLLLIMNFCFKISANCNMQETSYCAAPKYTLFAAFSRLDIKTFLLYCLSVIASLLFSYGVYWLFERRTDALKAYIRKCLT